MSERAFKGAKRVPDMLKIQYDAKRKNRLTKRIIVMRKGVFQKKHNPCGAANGMSERAFQRMRANPVYWTYTVCAKERTPLNRPFHAPLFNGDGFSEVTGLIRIPPSRNRQIIGQVLQGQDGKERREMG